MITPAQCRAARALLNWTQDQLAKAATVGIVTIRQFEGANADPRHATLVVITRALEAAGVEFIPENGGGAGVRLRMAGA
nr:helix-turn-helix domain-containing protein [Lichenihabitans psoromatis]